MAGDTDDTPSGETAVEMLRAIHAAQQKRLRRQRLAQVQQRKRPVAFELRGHGLPVPLENDWPVLVRLFQEWVRRHWQHILGIAGSGAVALVLLSCCAGAAQAVTTWRPPLSATATCNAAEPYTPLHRATVTATMATTTTTGVSDTSSTPPPATPTSDNEEPYTPLPLPTLTPTTGSEHR